MIFVDGKVYSKEAIMKALLAEEDRVVKKFMSQFDSGKVWDAKKGGFIGDKTRPAQTDEEAQEGFLFGAGASARNSLQVLMQACRGNTRRPRWGNEKRSQPLDDAVILDMQRRSFEMDPYLSATTGESDKQASSLSTVHSNFALSKMQCELDDYNNDVDDAPQASVIDMEDDGVMYDAQENVSQPPSSRAAFTDSPRHAMTDTKEYEIEVPSMMASDIPETGLSGADEHPRASCFAISPGQCFSPACIGGGGGGGGGNDNCDDPEIPLTLPRSRLRDLLTCCIARQAPKAVDPHLAEYYADPDRRRSAADISSIRTQCVTSMGIQTFDEEMMTQIMERR
eukprot:gene20137-24106_t